MNKYYTIVKLSSERRLIFEPPKAAWGITMKLRRAYGTDSSDRNTGF